MLFFLLGACGVDWGFGGQDMGDYADAETREPNSAPQNWETDEDMGGAIVEAAGIEDFSSWCEFDGVDPTAPDTLQLVAGIGTIGVTHAGLVGCSSARWIPVAEIVVPNLYVYYSNVNAALPCGEPCAWTFEYTVTGLDAGNWTVWAGDGTGQITVD